MKKRLLNGILYGATGSFWWGLPGVLYFKYVSFAGPLELVAHRSIWTSIVLIFTISMYSRWNLFLKICKSKKKLVFLFFSGILIYLNWSVWIYAVATNRLIDASF